MSSSIPNSPPPLTEGNLKTKFPRSTNKDPFNNSDVKFPITKRLDPHPPNLPKITQITEFQPLHRRIFAAINFSRVFNPASNPEITLTMPPNPAGSIEPERSDSPLTDRETASSDDSSNLLTNPVSSISSTSTKLSLYQDLISQLKLEGYPPKVQNILINCFRTKNPTLNLSRCGLEEIPVCIYTNEGFRHIRKLDLSYNKVSSVFIVLPWVEFLDFSFNRITTFSLTAPNLTRLLLSNNELTRFSGKFPKLSNLILSHNSISSFPLKLKELTSLQISNNKLTQFDGSSFPKLEKLYLKHNPDLNPEYRNTIAEHTVIQDDFEAVRLFAQKKDLTDESFEVQKRIMDCFALKSPSLDLSCCGLTKIPSCLRQNLFITNLNLSNNELTTLSFELPLVETLNLSANQFSEFSIDPSLLPELNNLDLSKNNLTSFASRSNSLTTLDLSMNKLKSSRFKLENALNLIQLNLSNNSLLYLGSINAPALKALDVSYNKFDNLSVNFFTKLKTLKASNNQINTIKLNKANNIQELYLAHNRLSSFDSTMFSKALTHLDVQDNYLPPLRLNLPRGGLVEDTLQESNKKLIALLELQECSPTAQSKIIECFQSEASSLDLSRCGLKKIPPCIYRELKVTDLNLSHNELSEFDLNSPFLKTLNLDYNQFVEFRITPGQCTDLTNVRLSYNMIRRHNIYLPRSRRVITVTTENTRSPSTEQLINALGLIGYSEKAQTRIMKCFESGTPNLDLRGCDLKTVPPSIFTKLAISHLDLSDNQITEVLLPKNQLVSLILERNNIAQFSTDETRSPSLTELNLFQNPIKPEDINLGSLDIIAEVSES